MDRICPKCITGEPHSVCNWMFAVGLLILTWSVLTIGGYAIRHRLNT